MQQRLVNLASLSRVRLSAFLVGLLACFGCGGTDDAPLPTPVAANDSAASVAQPNADAASPSEPDDVAPQAKNPIIRGLQSALGAAPLEDAAPGLRDDLEEADDLLSRVKRENAAALRQANRQMRLRGHGSPNLVLIVAEGLKREELGSYAAEATTTPHIDELAQHSVRFTEFRAPTREGEYWRRLLTGRRVEEQPDAWRARPNATLAATLWQAGYATYLMGDCSAGGLFNNADPRDFGFDDWLGIRDAHELQNPFPDHLETAGGARLNVAENADGQKNLPAGELYTRAAKAQLARLRRGRPFFLLLVYPPLVADKPADLDRHIGAVVDYLEESGMARHTMVMLTAPGDLQNAEHQPTSLAPMIVKPAATSVGPATSDHEWAVEDLLPTLADAVSAMHRPRPLDGKSAWQAFRQTQATPPAAPPK